MTEARLALKALADTPREIVIGWPDGAAAAAAPLLAVPKDNSRSACAPAVGPEWRSPRSQKPAPSLIARWRQEGARPPLLAVIVVAS